MPAEFIQDADFPLLTNDPEQLRKEYTKEEFTVYVQQQLVKYFLRVDERIAQTKKTSYPLAEWLDSTIDWLAEPEFDLPNTEENK